MRSTFTSFASAYVEIEILIGVILPICAITAAVITAPIKKLAVSVDGDGDDDHQDGTS